MKADFDQDRDKASAAADAGAERRVAVVVCSTCRNAAGSDARPRPGEILAEDARRAAAGTAIRVETVECLGNCRRRLSAAIVKDGAWSYLFGDLAANSGADLIEGAMLFAHAPDGVLPWRGRPASLKQGLVGRIPPVFSHPASSHKDHSA